MGGREGGEREGEGGREGERERERERVCAHHICYFCSLCITGTQRAKGTSSPGPSLDESIILTFLTGEMCLRGVGVPHTHSLTHTHTHTHTQGSGWWIHELCLMKQVKQIHLVYMM